MHRNQDDILMQQWDICMVVDIKDLLTEWGVCTGKYWRLPEVFRPE